MYELLGRRDECAALDRLVADVLASSSRVLILQGEAGVGKSALLRYLSGRISGEANGTSARCSPSSASAPGGSCSWPWPIKISR